MKIYKVGGYVRDKLLGLEPKDCDYVVVGSNEAEMLSLGFEQVGKDFPVFLHPKTRDEYALARKETKSGIGYNGFTVETNNITLEEDLFRRDLTINSMALTHDNKLIDPYNGKKDLKNKVLRHVSEHFCEDPVRILRICRFSARYDFKIADETITLMKSMIENGEFNSLTKERVWKEFEKVLTEPHLKNFFFYLNKIGALEKLSGFDSQTYLDLTQDKEFQNTKKLSFFNKIHNIYSYDKEAYFTNNLLFCFSKMSKKDLINFKIPTDYINKITIYAEWNKNTNFYSALNSEEKIKFIMQNKALHDSEQSTKLLEYILVFLNKEDRKEEEINILLDDIHQLKSLNYKELVEYANKEKLNINHFIREQQLNCLNSKKKNIKPIKF